MSSIRSGFRWCKQVQQIKSLGAFYPFIMVFYYRPVVSNSNSCQTFTWHRYKPTIEQLSYHGKRVCATNEYLLERTWECNNLLATDIHVFVLLSQTADCVMLPSALNYKTVYSHLTISTINNNSCEIKVFQFKIRWVIIVCDKATKVS